MSASIHRIALAFVLAAACASAVAQQKAPAYEPTSGQEGKDVVWIPTPQVVVDKMLDLARVGPRDFVMDLGSGDGRTVITAAKRGARAIGVEYNPDMVEYARRSAQHAGVADRASFVKADLFETDLSKATVITMFLLPDINLKLRPKILELKPGTRIVSNTFSMGDWKEDDRVDLSKDAGCNVSWCTALFWVVPAKVAGTYKVQGGEVTLKQEFQMLSGTVRTEGKTFVLQGKVTGEEVVFLAGGKRYAGRVTGKTLELH